MHKISILLGFGAGYVLGAKAGRSRYEELKHSFENLKANPRTQDVATAVQVKASEAADAAKHLAVEKVSVVKDKVSETGAHKSESDKAEGNQSTASGAPSSGAASEGVLDLSAGPKGPLP